MTQSLAATDAGTRAARQPGRSVGRRMETIQLDYVNSLFGADRLTGALENRHKGSLVEFDQLNQQTERVR